MSKGPGIPQITCGVFSGQASFFILLPLAVGMGLLYLVIGGCGDAVGTRPGGGQEATASELRDDAVISWSITDLDDYFQGPGPAGETQLQTTERLKAWQQEWDRDFRGRLVRWTGLVRDVRPDGTLVLRCNPKVSTDDTRVKLREESLPTASTIRREQAVTFRARLQSYGSSGYELYDGQIEEVHAAVPEQPGPDQRNPAALPLPVAPPPQMPARPYPPSNPQPKVKSIGEQGRLDDGGVGEIPVAATEKALDDMFKTFAAKDKQGFVDMVLSGDILLVPEKTKVLVIDRGGFLGSKRKVRILEGGQEGVAGWVPYEWVQ